MAKLTPLKAVRKKCLDCCCGQITEVRLCTVKNCALYPYRMGHRPQDNKNIVNHNNDEKTGDSKGFLNKEGGIL